MKKLVYAVLFILAAILFTTKLADPDIWWRLKLGEYIYANHALPSTLLGRYTCQTLRWIDYSWAYDLASYLIHQAAGINGLLVLSILTGLLGLYFFFITTEKSKRGYISAILFILTIIAVSFRITPRPEVVSYLFFAVYLYIFRVIDKRTVLPCGILLVLLQALWSNIHGYFVLGLAVSFAYFIDSLFKKKEKITGVITTVEFGVMFIALTVASMLNPFLWRIWLIPLDLLSILAITGNAVFKQYVIEFNSAFMLFPVFSAKFWEYKVMIIISALLLFFPNKRKVVQVVLYIPLLVLSIISIRNIALFCFFAMVISIDNLPAVVLSFENKIGKLYKNIIIAAFIICSGIFGGMVVTNKYYYSQRDIREFGLGIKKEHFMSNAAEFVKNMKSDIRMFNDFTSGGYLMWRLFPKTKVFIDGRCTMSIADFFGDYTETLRYHENYDITEKKYGINTVVLDYSDLSTKTLVSYLWRKNGWRVAFIDSNSIVFVDEKIAEVNSIPIKDSFYFLGKQKLAVMESLPDTAAKNRIPSKAVAVAQLFCILGYYAEAVDVYTQILDVHPKLYEGWAELGNVYAYLGRRDDAMRCFNTAKQIEPSYYAAYLFFGQLVEKEGDVILAERMYELALEKNNRAIDARTSLAELYVKKNEIIKAIEQYNALETQLPRDEDISTNLGFLYLSQQKIGLAKKKFEKIFNPKHGRVFYGLGTTMVLSGNHSAALAYFEKAIQAGYTTPEILSDYGILLFESGNRQKAVSVLKECIAKYPEFWRAWHNLYIIYSKIGKREESKMYYKRAVELHPALEKN
ncbi:MAG: tetratricopeptide repeat protein [Elusimicrobiota bacterium]